MSATNATEIVPVIKPLNVALLHPTLWLWLVFEGQPVGKLGSTFSGKLTRCRAHHHGTSRLLSGGLGRVVWRLCFPLRPIAKWSFTFPLAPRNLTLCLRNRGGLWRRALTYHFHLDPHSGRRRRSVRPIIEHDLADTFFPPIAVHICALQVSLQGLAKHGDWCCLYDLGNQL